MLNVANRIVDFTEFYELANRVEKIPGFLHGPEGAALYTLAAEGYGVGAIVELGSLFGRSTSWLAAGSQKTQREGVVAIDLFSFSNEESPNLEGMLLEEQEAILRKDLLDSEHRGRSLNVFQKNIREMNLAERVTAIVATSEEAAKDWDKPIRLLFVDADHGYEAVKKDFEKWSPHVCLGGCIAFHDVGDWPGVTRFYEEFTETDNGFKHLIRVGTLAVAHRVSA